MKQHPLEGKWYDPECEWVSFHIKFDGEKIEVKAVDQSDQECLEIESLKWDNSSIEFDLYTPSTNHRSHHEITELPNNEASIKITYGEIWKLRVE